MATICVHPSTFLSVFKVGRFLWHNQPAFVVVAAYSIFGLEKDVNGYNLKISLMRRNQKAYIAIFRTMIVREFGFKQMRICQPREALSCKIVTFFIIYLARLPNMKIINC